MISLDCLAAIQGERGNGLHSSTMPGPMRRESAPREKENFERIHQLKSVEMGNKSIVES